MNVDDLVTSTPKGFRRSGENGELDIKFGEFAHYELGAFVDGVSAQHLVTIS